MVKRYVSDERLAPLPNERFTAPDFGRAGEMIGEAVQGFGQAVGGAVRDLDAIALKHDEAAVRQADAEDALKISEIKQKALAAQGMDAHDAIDQARKDIDAVGRTRQESFSSGRQRQMYSDVFSRRQLGAVEALGEHGFKQVEVARQASLTATIDSSTTVAIDSHDDREEMQRNIHAIDEAVAEKYKGMPGNVVSVMQRKHRSAVHEGVVEQMMQDPDTAGEAAIYLKDHASEIEPAAETKLWREVHPYLEEERTMSDASWATSMAPLPGETEVDTPEPAGGEEAPEPPAGPAIRAPAQAETSARMRGFINPLGRGVGRVSNTAAQHRARGSDNAVDIAAKEGTPIRPPMSGKVIKSWYSEEGGWSVMVQHPNGYVTGYAHMRAKSPVDVGTEVDNTFILGTVGSTGKATGPHLHYTVRKSIDGPKEDPQTLAWVDKGAIDPKSANWKESALPKYEEEDTNVARALGRLHDRATVENWSPRRYEKAAAEIRQRGAINQQLYNQRQQDLYDGAAAAVAAADLAGKPVTTIAAVPNYHLLDNAGRARIDTAIAANKKALADGGVAANGPTFLDLFQMSGENQEDFKKVDLRTVPGITTSERVRLIGIQKNMVGKDNEPTNFAAKHARVSTMVNRFANMGQTGYRRGAAAKKEDKQREAVLFRAVTDRVSERQAELKRELTDDEIEGIVRSQVVAVTRSGDTMPRYIAERTPKEEGEVDQVEVPRDKQAAIIQSYRRANNGRMPTHREVVARYLQYLSLGGR